MKDGSVRTHVQILGLQKRSWYEGDCRDQPQIPSEGPYHARDTPAQPIARASAAAHKRRARSLITRDTLWYFRRMSVTVATDWHDILSLQLAQVIYSQALTTNLMPDVRICRARLDPVLAETAPRRYQLTTDVSASAGSTMRIHWLHDPCSVSTFHGQARFIWDVKGLAGSFRLDVQAPSGSSTLFAAGGASDDAKTGPWVRSGSVFTLRSDAGVGLVSAHIRYTPCKEADQP